MMITRFSNFGFECNLRPSTEEEWDDLERDADAMVERCSLTPG